jgi:hypothetical protein
LLGGVEVTRCRGGEVILVRGGMRVRDLSGSRAATTLARRKRGISEGGRDARPPSEGTEEGGGGEAVLDGVALGLEEALEGGEGLFAAGGVAAAGVEGFEGFEGS